MPALPNIASVLIAWPAVPNTQNYVLGVVERDSRAQVVQEVHPPDVLQRTLIGLKDCFWYYYEVVAISLAGQFTLIDSGNFQTVLPARNLRATGNDDGSARFDWVHSCGFPGHNRQFLDIGTSPGSNNIAAIELSLGAVSYRLPAGSLDPGTYWWRVNNKYGYTWFPSENSTVDIPAKPECWLDIGATTGGTTSPAPGSYPGACGRRETITAMPDPGWEFSHWSGDASGTNPTVTLIIDRNKRVFANFREIRREPATDLRCNTP